MTRQVEPALVIGVPVGFVGAAASKDELRVSGLPALSNVSEKGGSAVAVAAFNALLRIAKGEGDDPAADPARSPGSAQPGSAQPGSAQPGSAQPGSAQPGSAR
jgi:hypothetical protein